VPPNGLDYNGTQPVSLPDGTLIVVFTAFASGGAFSSEIVASRSTDGGASFTTPITVAPLSSAAIPGIRTFSLATVEADAAGRIYAAWEGCPTSGACSASRIVMSTSTDGVAWTAPVSITVPSTSSDHFLPGLGADPSAQGRLALVYYSVPDNCANEAGCRGVDAFFRTSANGGRTWTKAQRLSAETMPLDAIPRTRSGLMLADYVSTSYVRGRPIAIFIVAAPRIGGVFRQAAFAYRPRA
jgi:hypothetical protein